MYVSCINELRCMQCLVSDGTDIRYHIAKLFIGRAAAAAGSLLYSAVCHSCQPAGGQTAWCTNGPMN